MVDKWAYPKAVTDVEIAFGGNMEELAGSVLSDVYLINPIQQLLTITMVIVRR